MTNRRSFFQAMAALPAAQLAVAAPQGQESDRQYWVRLVAKVAEPVLVNLASV